MKFIKVKLFYSVICLFVSTSLFAQNKELFINYDYEDKGYRVQMTAKLRTFQSEELFSLTTIMPMGTSIDNPLGEPKESTSFIYKNRETNELISEEFAMNRCYVRDSLNLFDWEIKQERVFILGYKCTKAEASYRGRDFVAYFTVDLPFTAAPWKIHGLPGVVLKVHTKDSFLTMEANEIRISNPEAIIKPYKKEKFISWDEYEKTYRKSILMVIEIDKMESAKMGENNSPIRFAPPNIEIIMKGNEMNADEALKSQRKNMIK